jgi:hypothetical protein
MSDVGLHNHAFAAVFLALAMTATAPAAETGEEDFDSLAGELLRKKLVGDQPQEFAEPPWVGPAATEPPPASSGAGSSKKLFLSAGMLLSSTEHGAVTEFVGSDGSGTEVRLGYGAPNRWSLSIALSQTVDGAFSQVDGTESVLNRFMLGTGRSWRLGRKMSIGAGGGLAMNILDIDDPEPNRDIEGLGGYLELRLGLTFGSFDVGVSGRALAWQGTDGFGNKGSEFSTVIGADLGLRF